MKWKLVKDHPNVNDDLRPPLVLLWHMNVTPAVGRIYHHADGNIATVAWSAPRGFKFTHYCEITTPDNDPAPGADAGVYERLVLFFKAAGGIHNPDANAPILADAIIELIANTTMEPGADAIKAAILDALDNADIDGKGSTAISI